MMSQPKFFEGTFSHINFCLCQSCFESKGKGVFMYYTSTLGGEGGKRQNACAYDLNYFPLKEALKCVKYGLRLRLQQIYPRVC